MRTRIFFAIVAAITLASCSGGGANGTLPNPGNGSTQPMSQQEQAQTGVNSAMSEIESTSLDSTLFSGSVGVTLSTAKAQTITKAMASCVNGVIKTVTVVSPTETQYDTQIFYDLACTQLRQDRFADVQKPNASTEIIALTVKDYNNAGLLLSTRSANFSITGSPGSFSAVVTSKLVIGTSTTPQELSGHQLTVAPQNPSTFTIAGNGARVENIGIPSVNESFGEDSVLQNVTATLNDPSSGDVTFAGTRNKNFFKGPLGSLSIPPSPPFTVSGGSLVGTGSLSGQIVFDSNDMLMSVSLNGTLPNGDTIVVTSTGSGATIAINGTITSPGGTQLATFSVDRFGNGIITYANGAQAIIMDWHVVG